VWNLRFLLWCCWRLSSSGAKLCVNMPAVDTLRNSSASISRIKQSKRAATLGNKSEGGESGHFHKAPSCSSSQSVTRSLSAHIISNSNTCLLTQRCSSITHPSQPLCHEPTQCILALPWLTHHPHLPLATFTYVIHPTLSVAILSRRLDPEDENYSPSIWTSHTRTAPYSPTHHCHLSHSSGKSDSSETLTYEVWHIIRYVWVCHENC
jgi:hypothetical protein